MSTSEKCFCGKLGDKRCTKCKTVCYCSRECQIVDFPKHKKLCKLQTSTEVVSEKNANISEAYIKCVCGKPANKTCSKCLMFSYCSRECQIDHFPNHKTQCKMLKANSVPTVGERSWREIMNLPAACIRNPLPTLSLSCPRIPLEQLLPLFLLMYTVNHQNLITQGVSPAHVVLRNDNELTVVTLNVDPNLMTGKQKFTSFNTFSNNGKTQFQNSRDRENWKMAYLYLSFMAKCNQVVCCFALLILKALNSHQLTYCGEKVVGWAVQDGNMKLNHSQVIELRVVKLSSLQELSPVTESVRTGTPLPQGVEKADFTSNATHVWLTFVTESGRIFDLDLSAFQFGIMTPFPCIVPVLSAASTAFNGICDRDRVMPANLPDLRENVMELLDRHAKMINTSRGSTVTSGETMASDFNATISRVLQHTARGGLMESFTSPDSFWNELKNMYDSDVMDQFL